MLKWVYKVLHLGSAMLKWVYKVLHLGSAMLKWVAPDGHSRLKAYNLLCTSKVGKQPN